MHSNSYTFIYAAVLSAITAVTLAFISESLKPAQNANVALDTKTNILKSVRFDNADRAAIEKKYAESITEMVLDGKGNKIEGVSPASVNLKDEVVKSAADRRLPLYIFKGDDGKSRYIIPLRGVGLWGPIWGHIALEEDFNTVFGATFDHKSETPGLGAEIAESFFQKQFEGKKIMSGEHFISVKVLKTSAKSDYGTEHRVDAISGGTITSNGTDAMLANCIEPYLPYFNKLKTQVAPVPSTETPQN